MSYNPAFVSDESPLANTAERDASNGVKLTSFKMLPAAAQARPAPKAKRQAPGPAPAPAKLAPGAPASKPTTTRSSNLCMSTSSSLSLIDNPTLSSLTPSTTSYSTTASHSSSIESASLALCAAVECRDMRYSVGFARNHKTILHDINVTVPEGSIYGLLGPSGCGKTTMLRCVVGRIKPKSGSVRVFGYKPNESGSQIPGPAIGYMPQVSVARWARFRARVFGGRAAPEFEFESEFPNQISDPNTNTNPNSDPNSNLDLAA